MHTAESVRDEKLTEIFSNSPCYYYLMSVLVEGIFQILLSGPNSS